jgi:hypothetical protein
MQARDMKTCDEAGRVHWVAGVALLFLAAGLAVWFMNTSGGSGSRSDEVIDQALSLANPDSVAIKTKWVETVPDVDTSDLDPDGQEAFVRLVNARYCDCGCGYTLGACRNFDPTCEFSGPIVEALLDSLRAGHAMSVEGLRPRPDGSG